MRRADRMVTDFDTINLMLSNCKTCYVSMLDGELPYCVPLNFAYKFDSAELCVYFHCAKAGKKLDILNKNPKVHLVMANEGNLIHTIENPCNSGYFYESLMASGKVEFVDDIAEKCEALSLLMKHQANQDFVFNEAQANTVCVFKVCTKDFTAKKKLNPNKGV